MILLLFCSPTYIRTFFVENWDENDKMDLTGDDVTDEEEDLSTREFSFSFSMNGEGHTLYIKEGEVEMASKAGDLAKKLKVTKSALNKYNFGAYTWQDIEAKFDTVLENTKNRKKFRALATRKAWLDKVVKPLLDLLSTLTISPLTNGTPDFSATYLNSNAGVFGLNDLNAQAVLEVKKGLQ